MKNKIALIVGLVLIIGAIGYVVLDKKSDVTVSSVATSTTSTSTLVKPSEAPQTPHTPTISVTSPNSPEITAAVSENLATTTIAPVITSVVPSPVVIGSSITLNGNYFDPVGGWSGIGWISNPHTFVTLIDSTGHTATLWYGNEPDATPNPITTSINFVLSPKACSLSGGQMSAFGGCPAQDVVTVMPGKYAVVVSSDGRGSSNFYPITIQ